MLREVVQDREQLLQVRPVRHFVQVDSLEDSLAELGDCERQATIGRFDEADFRLGRHLSQVRLCERGLQRCLSTGGLVRGGLGTCHGAGVVEARFDVGVVELIHQFLLSILVGLLEDLLHLVFHREAASVSRRSVLQP